MGNRGPALKKEDVSWSDNWSSFGIFTINLFAANHEVFLYQLVFMVCFAERTRAWLNLQKIMPNETNHLQDSTLM